MSTPNLTQLQRAVTITEKIESLKSELASIVGGSAVTITPLVAKPALVKKKGGMSPAHKAKLKAAAQARWARIKAGKEKSPFGK